LLRIRPFLIALFIVFNRPVTAEPIDSISRIRSLSPEEAAGHLPVVIERR
jgi:hypothetical protein